MAFPTETQFVMRAALVSALVLALGMTVVWSKVRGEDRDAMKQAAKSCVARLGSQAECEARIAEHHRVCFNYNNRAAGRGSPRTFDAEGYLACAWEGPEPWAERVRTEREARQKAVRADPTLRR